MELQKYKWISVDIAARRLDISRETVHRLIKSQQIEAYKFGRSVKISEAAFSDYLEPCKITEN